MKRKNETNNKKVKQELKPKKCNKQPKRVTNNNNKK